MRILRGLLSIMARKITTLPKWYSERCYIGNWFYIWLLTNSIINHIFKKIWGNYLYSDLCVKFKDNTKLYVSIDKLDEGIGFIHTLDRYLDTLTYHYSEFELTRGDVVIDVGAHVGAFATKLAIKYEDIFVYAYEAEALNFNILKKNVEENFLTKRVYVEHLAIYNETGTIDFCYGTSSTTGSIGEVGAYKIKKGHKKYFAVNKKTLSVKTATLADIFTRNSISNCKLIKIDCEGCEYAIFTSLPEQVFNSIQYLILEAHPTANYEPDFLVTFLKGKGFDIRQDELGNGCLELYCRRVS